jgi:hypothetical protein
MPAIESHCMIDDVPRRHRCQCEETEFIHALNAQIRFLSQPLCFLSLLGCEGNRWSPNYRLLSVPKATPGVILNIEHRAV